MTQKEANKLMVERFEQMVEKSQSTNDAEKQLRYLDCAHKLFITLTNAGAFEGEPMDLGQSGFKN